MSALTDATTLPMDILLCWKYFPSYFGIQINMYWKKKGRNRIYEFKQSRFGRANTLAFNPKLQDNVLLSVALQVNDIVRGFGIITSFL